MRTASCLILSLGIIFIAYSSGRAEYNGEKLSAALGELLFMDASVEFISTTECGEFIDFDYKKPNVHHEAKKYLSNDDYDTFLLIETKFYEIGKENFSKIITDGIAKKKSEGQSTEQLCANLLKKVKKSYEDTIHNWNISKQLFSK